MKHIRAANWVAEKVAPEPGGFRLLGTSKGYSTFKSAFVSAQDVWYAAHDEHGNREAGHAYFTGSRLTKRTPTATLVNGVYSHLTPHEVQFKGEVTLACTFNSAAFNLLWESLQALDPDGDGNINIPPELIEGLIETLKEKADQVDLDAEVQARIAGDKHLQEQIDGLEGGTGGGPVSWESILDKPQSISDLGYKDTVDGGTYKRRFIK